MQLRPTIGTQTNDIARITGHFWRYQHDMNGHTLSVISIRVIFLTYMAKVIKSYSLLPIITF